MTQVWSGKDRTSRCTSSMTTGGTTEGASGSLKLSDGLRKSQYESGMIKGGFS